MRPLCSISIDLDSLRCYREIHGLSPRDEAGENVIYDRCLPRFAEVFARHGIKATLFAVASDIDEQAYGARANENRLRECVASGHEVASHSYSHFYDLGRLGPERVAAEIGRAHQVLSGLGTPVVGFRSPGYGLSPVVARELAARDYVYDSSILPAPSYFAAKAAVMAVLAVSRRPSGAVMTDPRMLAAPTQPYHLSLDKPWRRGRAALLEMPIAVSSILRVPLIGTSLLMTPDSLYPVVRAAIERLPFFNFELHGIDLADSQRDDIGEDLVRRQPDLRVPLEVKRERLQRLIRDLAECFEIVTLAAAARTFV